MNELLGRAGFLCISRLGYDAERLHHAKVVPYGPVATMPQIEEGDRDGWYEQWAATADRIAALGDETASAGHMVSARDAYLRRLATTPLPTCPCSVHRSTLG